MKNLNCFLINSVYNENSTIYMANITLSRQPAYMSLYKLSLCFLCALLCTVCLAFGIGIHGAYKRYCTFVERALVLQKEVDLAEKRLGYQETYVYKLEHDASFLEKTLRERLGYSTSNELIFRFDDSTPAL